MPAVTTWRPCTSCTCRRRDREAAFRHLAAAVAPGGTLLIVAHHPSDLEIPGLRTAGPGFPPPGPELFFTGDEIAAAIGADGPAGRRPGVADRR